MLSVLGVGVVVVGAPSSFSIGPSGVAISGDIVDNVSFSSCGPGIAVATVRCSSGSIRRRRQICLLCDGLIFLIKCVATLGTP